MLAALFPWLWDKIAWWEIVLIKACIICLFRVISKQLTGGKGDDRLREEIARLNVELGGLDKRIENMEKKVQKIGKLEEE